MPNGEGFTVIEVVAVLTILVAVAALSYLAIPIF
jgi:prepilin-type N-terminal cleavage/methylation domain-containing protein